MEYINIGTEAGEEIDFDPTDIDALIAMQQDSLQMKQDKLNALKKRFSIPSSPDKEINQMQKRSEKSSIDNLGDEIDDGKDAEEELDKLKDTMSDMYAMNQQLQKTNSSITQSQTASSGDITNSEG